MTSQEMKLFIEKFTHLEKKLDEMSDEINELKELWSKAQGMWLLLKFCTWIVAPLWAVIYWVKDHVKF